MNDMARKKKAVNPRGKAPYFHEQEFLAVIDRIGGRYRARNRAILLVSYYAGLRAQEIALLRIEQIVQAGKLAEVAQLGGITKGGRPREAYLVKQELRNAMASYLASRGTDIASGPVFASQKGGHICPNAMQRLIGKLYRDAGVRGTSHSGRRSFATNLAEHADVRTIQRLMGHADISTTFEYIDTTPSRMMAAMRKL